MILFLLDFNIQSPHFLYPSNSLVSISSGSVDAEATARITDLGGRRYGSTGRDPLAGKNP